MNGRSRFAVDRYPDAGAWIPCLVGPPWRTIWIDSTDPREFDRQLRMAWHEHEREHSKREETP